MLTEPGCICTADDFFMKDGKYQWDAAKIGAAHVACHAKCERLMQMQLPTIVVANTSVAKKDLRGYYGFAEKYGYKVFSIIVENRHNGINEHGVSEQIVENMRSKFDVQL